MPKAFSPRATTLQTDVLLNRYRVQVASDAAVLEETMVATINDNRGARSVNAQDTGFPITSDDNSITIGTFTANLNDGSAMTFPAHVITGLTSSTFYSIFYDPASGTYAVDAVKPSALWLDAEKVWLAQYSTSAAGVFPSLPTPPGGYAGGGAFETSSPL